MALFKVSVWLRFRQTRPKLSFGSKFKILLFSCFPEKNTPLFKVFSCLYYSAHVSVSVRFRLGFGKLMFRSTTTEKKTTYSEMIFALRPHFARRTSESVSPVFQQDVPRVVEVALELLDAERTLPRGLFLVDFQVGQVCHFRGANHAALATLVTILA